MEKNFVNFSVEKIVKAWKQLRLNVQTQLLQGLNFPAGWKNFLLKNTKIGGKKMQNYIDRNFYKSDPIFPKSKFRMCIATMREVPEESGEKHFQLVDETYLDCSGKQFRESLNEDAKKGITHDIEIVYERPKTFVFNKIYLLATRDTVWVWKLIDED